MNYELTTRIRDFPSSGCPEFGFIYGSSRNFLLLHSSRFDAQNPDPIVAHWSFRLECLFGFITSFRTPVNWFS